jgi:hypothetical protein
MKEYTAWIPLHFCNGHGFFEFLIRLFFKYFLFVHVKSTSSTLVGAVLVRMLIASHYFLLNKCESHGRHIQRLLKCVINIRGGVH